MTFCDSWVSARIIAFGYYDGPTEGALQLTDGRAYRFEAVAYDRQREMRALSLGMLPARTFDELVGVLTNAIGPPRWPIWIPRWQFPTDDELLQANASVDSMMAAAGPPTIGVACDDSLKRCIAWIDAANMSKAEIGSWLASLAIPP